jgi:hypothetical protein
MPLGHDPLGPSSEVSTRGRRLDVSRIRIDGDDMVRNAGKEVEQAARARSNFKDPAAIRPGQQVGENLEFEEVGTGLGPSCRIILHVSRTINRQEPPLSENLAHPSSLQKGNP